MGKPDLNEIRLNEPEVSFSIIEIENYTYYNSNGTGSGTENKQIKRNLFSSYIFFNDFIGANLLEGITLPFSIILPLTARPSISVYSNGCYKYENSIKHYFAIEMPCFKVKRVMSTIVKNTANFTEENKLLKTPYIYYALKSKSKFLTKKGNFSIKIKLQKNAFHYDEFIPYEIILDYKNLNLIITELEVSLLRHIKQIIQENCNQRSVKISKNKIISKNILLNKNQKEHIIQDSIFFPKTFDIYPPAVYESIESNEALFPKKSFDSSSKKIIQFFNRLIIAPSCNMI